MITRSRTPAASSIVAAEWRGSRKRWPSRAARGPGLSRNVMSRLAAIGFGATGIPGVVVMPFFLAWIAANDRLPVMGGATAFGGGPLETLGPRGVALIGVPFLITSALEVVAMRWLWRGERRGSVLGAALAPLTSVFAVGYDLPIWYALIPMRTLLLALGWRHTT